MIIDIDDYRYTTKKIITISRSHKSISVTRENTVLNVNYVEYNL